MILLTGQHLTIHLLHDKLTEAATVALGIRMSGKADEEGAVVARKVTTRNNPTGIPTRPRRTITNTVHRDLASPPISRADEALTILTTMMTSVLQEAGV